MKELFNKYYNNGSYKRDTVINMNDAAKNELIKCFHAESNLLIRDTYFVGGELWMLNEAGTYSYYGTDGENMTSARTEKALYQPKSVHTAYVGHTMEKHYTTLFDIKDNEAEWTKNGKVYSTNNPDVIQMFLDFTAPCFYGLNETNKNYWTMSSVEVEETENSLKLRLLTSGDSGKITDDNGVLSVATITKDTFNVTITNIADALSAASSTPLCLQGTVVSYYTSGTNSFILGDGNGKNIVVYSPNKAVNLNDKVEVTGSKAFYNNKTHQVGSNPKVEVIEESGFKPSTTAVTLSEAIEIANKLDVDFVSQNKYTISGNIDIQDSYYYVSDGTNKIQLFGGSLEGLHQGCTVTITGNLTKYNNNNNIVELVKYTIDEIINCKYSLTINASENGSVSSTKLTDIEYNTTVTLTANPNEGYKVEALYVNDVKQDLDENNQVTITVKENLTVFATFIEEDVEVELQEMKATLNLSLASNRTSLSDSKQVWEENGIKVTNNKAGSSSSVANYTPPRFYAKSELIVEKANMTEIQFTCSGSSYVTPLKTSLENAKITGATVTVSGSVVTIKFSSPVDSITATMTAQVRMGNSIVVTYLG